VQINYATTLSNTLIKGEPGMRLARGSDLLFGNLGCLPRLFNALGLDSRLGEEILEMLLLNIRKRRQSSLGFLHIHGVVVVVLIVVILGNDCAVVDGIIQ
jgi:hypothetical protein